MEKQKLLGEQNKDENYFWQTEQKLERQLFAKRAE